MEALGSALQFDVQRAGYTKPLTITQVIRSASGGTVRQPLARWTLDGWNGLRGFLRVTVKSRSGAVMASRVMPFCPDSYNPQRATPDSPAQSPYPSQCSSSTPFVLGTVWGLAKGWGVDPFSSGFFFNSAISARLQVGKTYTVTMSIMPAWRAILHVTYRNSRATVKLQAVKPSQCNPCSFRRQARHSSRRSAGLAQQRVPTLASPPAAALPDLVPLPSWGIGVQNIAKTKRYPASSQLEFGATVSILGNGPLDVEGFATGNSPTMPAYQYFWRGNHVVGRVRAGTMGFDNAHGHKHWHFQQFAQYRLLSHNKSLILRSRKVGFCIAPTDAIDLLLPHATMVPSFSGFGGSCGSPSALWVQEMLPLGWGDTYFQSVAGQSFNITKVPNGVYYIEVIANPDRVLHETTYGNDISYRKIILGGTAAHRTVRVPAYDGIDPEN